jgi:preprotein translocase subunit SecB
MSTAVPVQPAIRFVSLQVVKVGFSNKFCGNQLPPDLQMSFSFAVSSLTESESEKEVENKFCIKFTIEFKDLKEIFDLNIEANAIFETNTPVTEEFLTTDFARLNAPAISFPFLRSFISTFTLNAGYNPIILPSFNFSTAAEVQKEEKL